LLLLSVSLEFKNYHTHLLPYDSTEIIRCVRIAKSPDIPGLKAQGFTAAF
jgi:hypothetical protein